MTATLRLPRMLAQAARTGLTHQVEGPTVSDVLRSLFQQEPGLQGHIVDESGEIRPHVSLFVDGRQASLDSVVRDEAEIRVLQAVSGG
jgi:molybdopterin synthase sulfur carrier subunit